jgi:hypothetical protein
LRRGACLPLGFWVLLVVIGCHPGKKWKPSRDLSIYCACLNCSAYTCYSRCLLWPDWF